jgi:hypothetical protein
MAQRSVNASLFNDTSYVLTLSSFNVTNGKTVASPPQTIPAGGTGSWETENEDLFTGTAGNVVYVGNASTGNFSVTCNWNDPFVGDDQFSGSTTLPGAHVSY